MKSTILVGTAALNLLLSPGAAMSETLTFENINPAPASFDVMPSSYSGFTFSGWYYGPDTFYTPASGTIDLFTDYADPADPGNYVITVNNSISRATDFYFDGAWFSGYSGVSFEFWNDGVLLGTSGALADAAGVDPYGPTYLASGFSGLVDTVKVSGVQGYYAMDDFTYHLAGTNNVPEPASLALAMLALGAASLVARRRKQQ